MTCSWCLFVAGPRAPGVCGRHPEADAAPTARAPAHDHTEASTTRGDYHTATHLRRHHRQETEQRTTPQPLPMHQYPLNPSCQPTLTQQLPLPLVRGRWRALAWVMLDSDAAVTAAFSRKLATAVSTNKARQPGARHRDNNTYCSLCWAEAMRVTPSTSTSGGHDDQGVRHG